MIPMFIPGARRAVAAMLLCGASAGLAQAPVPAPLLAPNDPAERLSGYLRTLAGDPANVVALNGAGRAALEIGDVNGALGFYGRAAQASPQNGDAKAGLAASLVQLEQPRRALPLFAQAVQLGVPVTTIAADRGLAYDLIGDGASAQRDYATALAASDSDETRRRYALSLGIGGQRDKALDLLDPLVRRRDPAGWRARAFVLALTGDTAGAGAIVEAMMPSQSAAMAPFMGELARLNPAQKAAAVNFGDMPAAGVAGGAGTQLAARDSTPMPNPVPRPTIAVPATPLPRPAPTPVARPTMAFTPAPLPSSMPMPRPAMTITPAPLPVVTAITRPATPPAPTAVIARPAPAQLAAVPVAAQARADVAAPPPSPAVVPTQFAARPIVVAPVTAAVATPAIVETRPAAPPPVPPRPADQTAAAVSPPAAVASSPRIAATEPSPAFIGPPAPPPATQPSAAPARVATVSPPPDRLALAASPPHAERIVPAAPVAGSDRMGPFRTVSKSEIDRQRAAWVTVEKHDGVPPASERAKARDDVAAADAASSSRATHGARAAVGDDADTRPARSAAAKAKAADRDDDADAPSAKGKPAKARPTGKSGKPSDDDDASASPVAKARRGKASDDAAAKPAARKGRSSDQDDDDAKPAKAGGVYVQVAGGANKDDMPKAWAQVKRQAPELLKGRTPSTTPLRFTNRLLVGPFKDEDEAQGFVNKLAGKGMPGTVFKSAKGQKIEKVPTSR